MRQLEINQEIKHYTEQIFFGLSLRQFLFSAIACIIAVIIYLTTIDYLGMELTSWCCILGAVPFAALGFITFQSMNAEDIVISLWRSFLLSNRNLIDKPTNLYYECSKPLINKEIREALRKDVKKSIKDTTIK